MMNITLLHGEWRRGADRIHPATARTLHARGACRLWIPISPETADALGWGKAATAREWHRFRFNEPVHFHAGTFLGPHVCVAVDTLAQDGSLVFRLYPRIPRPAHYEVIGASPRKGTPSGWCWEVRPRVGEPAIIECREGGC